MPVFVDTGAWFASIIAEDAEHQRAVGWLSQNRQPLLTTDYIVDEVITLLLYRAGPDPARLMGQRLLKSGLVELVYLSTEDISEAWEVFVKYRDKKWSFTDCTSKVIMQKHDITTAFAFDHHFEQFGGIRRVP